MNFKNKLRSLFFLLLIIMPWNVLAYSDYVIVGGNNIGIEVQSNGIMIVGYYEVEGKNIGRDAGFLIGDKIIKVESKKVASIEEMISKINQHVEQDSITFTVIRNNIEKDLQLQLVKDSSGVYKTGLYVKDQITGIGTLTYIDPGTKIFGALGHEIIEANSNTKIEVKDGKIFKSDITGIQKSTDTTTGEKNAIFDQSITYGTILENTSSGIYGKYLKKLETTKKLKVGNPEEIEIGPAKLLTVLKENNIEEYDINILKVNHSGLTKNILFEINDEKLRESTNGIIKGMSGSPIIQNDMIIGAVTHAIVNDNQKGYGIFITTMLKEGEN